MRAEDTHRPVRDVFDPVHEDDVPPAEILDYITIVDDFVKDVDRRLAIIQRALNNVDGPHHAGTEAARLGEHYSLNAHSIRPSNIVSINRGPRKSIIRFCRAMYLGRHSVRDA